MVKKQIRCENVIHLWLQGQKYKNIYGFDIYYASISDIHLFVHVR